MRTIVQARATNSGIIPEDKRGQHGNHRKIDKEIIESLKNHINSISSRESLSEAKYNQRIHSR